MPCFIRGLLDFTQPCFNNLKSIICFISAIERAISSTRPVHSIIRLYGGKHIIPVLLRCFVNENGYAVTCKHVAELLRRIGYINQRYAAFRKKGKNYHWITNRRLQLKGTGIKNIIISQIPAFRLRNNFIDCI